ncbi:MAG: hypothetical protein Q8P18_01140 [Pseudomonadota bacterium]|nr:hypothetical protein [Pseudomonadota bacterium]
MTLLALFACTPPDVGEVTVYAPEGAGLSVFLSTIGDDRVVVVEEGDPLDEAARARSAVAIAVTIDPAACGECFRLDEADGVYTVTGGAPLGIRYGVSAMLEAFGWRFFHPTDTFMPASPAEGESWAPDRTSFGVDQAPDVARRGLHLHTLHPIDGLYAFWTGESPERAAAITDWAVRNRANHLQWVALEDITESPSRLAAWQADTRPLVDHAHEQGLTVGLGIQLFGASNLQKAFDLVDDADDQANMRATMEERVAGLVGGAEWDVFNLSFGEFSGVEPVDFIAATNLARDVVRVADPTIEMTATIHVGAQEDLRVSWEGEEMIYYFLVQYADPSIVPWVHSVMYYNLVEDAGGAYGHDTFDEHRAFLEEKLAAEESVGYFPETAYWVAFDISVPTYLPLYVRSRWEDLAAFPTLEDHVLFSSGWEWGYWQNDWAALRMSWDTPADWRDVYAEMFAPVDPSLADVTVALAEVEHAHLIEGRMAPYLAGRDDFIDLGERIGVVAQPPRPEFDDVRDMPPETSAAIVASLTAMADDLAAVAPPTGDDRWSLEVADGLAVTTLRARYIATLYAAAADATRADTLLDEAAATLDAARTVVTRRHATLHDDVGGRLTVPGENPTLYQYGYLRWANELCYWEREYAQASNLLRGTTLDVPGCAL